MTTPIDTFLAQYAGREREIQGALAENDAPGGRRRNKFDVVADLIFPPREALPVLKIADWSTVKQSFAGLISSFYMLLLLAYRKRYVDQAVDSFCKKCQGRVAPPCADHPFPKSLGSTDLTSDYDITVGYTRVETSGAELDQIQNFNDHIRLKFGKQPGTIFDTNLYAKDFLPLNADDARLAMPGVGNDMYNMMVEGQDVGALVKLRRYMPNEDWLAFLDALLRDLDALDSAAVPAIRNRYKTADDQYLLNLDELLRELTDRAENKTAKLTREDAAQYQRAFETVERAVTKEILSPAERRFVSNSARADMAEVQLLLRYKALTWEHDYPDLVLWATNDLYVKKMKAIRNYQSKLGRTGNPAAGDVRVADLISSAIFFASEAYSSEGALRHVVDGAQAANARTDLSAADRAKIANETLMRLTVEQLLQSINEQFADFLKDFAHYGDTTEFLFRGAKYIQRLFEAADILAAKRAQTPEHALVALKDLDIKVIDGIFYKSCREILARLNQPTDGLVAVRRGARTFPDDTARNLYCDAEVRDYFGAANGTDLKNRITQMVLKLNAQVRSRLSTTPDLDQIKRYFYAIGSTAS
jgi:hypothetical protein